MTLKLSSKVKEKSNTFFVVYCIVQGVFINKIVFKFIYCTNLECKIYVLNFINRI